MRDQVEVSCRFRSHSYVTYAIYGGPNAWLCTRQPSTESFGFSLCPDVEPTGAKKIRLQGTKILTDNGV